MCATVLCGIGGVSVCCLWESLVWVWGSECVLCVGQFGVCLGSECVLFVGQFGVCLGAECVLCVGQFGMGLWE